MTLDDSIRDVQRTLGVTVDGKAGPETWDAIYRRLLPHSVAATVLPAPALLTTGGNGEVDARSEGVIGTLLAEVRPYARALVHQAAEHGIIIQVIQGLRSYAQQDALYAQGRTAKGKVVTNARGGYSNHNFGTAFDVGVFIGGKYADDLVENGAMKSSELERIYSAVGVLGRGLGLEWGGDWKSIQDAPHFELVPKWAVGLSESAMVAALRERHAAGQSAFA